STPRNVAVVFSAGNGLTVSDVDAAKSPVQVTLSAVNGTVTLARTAGLTFTTGSGTGDATQTFNPTLAAGSAALDGLLFHPTPNYGGTPRLTVSVNDQGNTGAGGPLSDTATVLIVVDTPGITVTPSGGLVTTEAGGQASFTAVLDKQPVSDVTI